MFGKYGISLDKRIDLAGLIGVGFPSTPAQTRAIFTAGGMGSYRFDDRITLFLNPRGTAQDSNVTVGIGVGTEVRVHPGLSIIGDWTGMIDGENTRSTSTGARIKGDVWGVALRWSSTDRWVHYAADFGYNTGTGSTTGFSLTPGLGNSGGFYFALSAHH